MRRRQTCSGKAATPRRGRTPHCSLFYGKLYEASSPIPTATPRPILIRKTPPMTSHTQRARYPRDRGDRNSRSAPPLESSKIEMGAPPTPRPPTSGPIPVQTFTCSMLTRRTPPMTDSTEHASTPGTPPRQKERRGAGTPPPDSECVSEVGYRQGVADVAQASPPAYPCDSAPKNAGGDACATSATLLFRAF